MAPARPTRSSRRGSPTRPTTSRCAPSRSASASAVPEAAGESDAPLDVVPPIGEAEVDTLFAPLQSFPTVILAVSGGADSMAMLYLAARWAKRRPKKGGKLVVATVDHGLRSESRREAQWVGEQARAMGLAPMSVCRPLDRDAGCQLVRPLLAIPGARLRATLRAAGLDWLEDPSNDCDRFERVRLRQARAALAALGLAPEKIALSARRLERARAALEAAAHRLQ